MKGLIFSLALAALGGCGGSLGSDLKATLNEPSHEAIVAASRARLLERLPIGSDIAAYSALFKKSGGECVEKAGAPTGDYLCRYSRATGLLATAEWIFDIRYDRPSGKSTAITVDFAVTSL